jgi:hypothetical protein
MDDFIVLLLAPANRVRWRNHQTAKALNAGMNRKGKTRSETQFHYITNAKVQLGYLVGREDFG